MYIRTGINDKVDLAIPEEEQSSKKKKKTGKKSANSTNEEKIENDNVPVINLESDRLIDPNLSEHYTPQGKHKSLDYNDSEKGDWDYVGRVEQILQSPDFEHVFAEIGYPPVPSIKDLQYSIVMSKGKESNLVIMPSSLFMRSEVNPLFSGLKFFYIS